MKITHNGDPTKKIVDLLPTKDEFLEALYQQAIGNDAVMKALTAKVTAIKARFQKGKP